MKWNNIDDPKKKNSFALIETLQLDMILAAAYKNVHRSRSEVDKPKRFFFNTRCITTHHVKN
jgi:hypothetical protein